MKDSIACHRGEQAPCSVGDVTVVDAVGVSGDTAQLASGSPQSAADVRRPAKLQPKYLQLRHTPSADVWEPKGVTTRFASRLGTHNVCLRRSLVLMRTRAGVRHRSENRVSLSS